MAPAASARAAVRRCGVLMAAGLALLVVLSWLGASASPAEAQTQTGNLWTVAAGSAAQIQPAIDAARNAGGGRVRLPAAVYLLTEKVRLHNNVILYGDGMDRTILRWAPGAALDHMMSNGALTDGNQNFQVWDLTLDGQNIPSGRTDCCFGFRLNNVQDIVVVNVAADNHSKDGFYIGYNRDNGAHRVRLSGCRANGNARNGISLIHGTNNVIDHCQVNNNNRGEAVAGIDLEPDEGQSLTDNKVIANSANGQNVGIQLFLPYNGYATMSNNAVCQNTATGNVSAGIYSNRGDRNIFVDNQTSGNGTNFLVDDSSLIGPQYASACQLGQLPPHPSTVANPTPTPTPPPACDPRPAVTVTTQATGGTLRVTVAATRPSSVPNNTIRQLQFATAQNATIEINGQNRPGGGFTVTLPAGTQQTTFTVRRQAGGQATTVPFSVVDECGAWPTFVGGGPSAF